jgi:hypothetical protein
MTPTTQPRQKSRCKPKVAHNETAASAAPEIVILGALRGHTGFSGSDRAIRHRCFLTHVGILKIRVWGGFGTTHTKTFQICRGEIGIEQVSISQISLGQIGATQIHTTHFGPAQIGPLQILAAQIGALQITSWTGFGLQQLFNMVGIRRLGDRCHRQTEERTGY